MLDLKPYVDYLIEGNVSKEEALDMLKRDVNLSKDEKNLIYCYCYPRPLLDYELPKRVQEYRKKNGLPMSGLLTPHIGEATLLVEAFRTDQYGRFMKHLISAFGNVEEIGPISGSGRCKCPICGKDILELDFWNSALQKRPGTKEAVNKEFLAIGSKKSSICMCKDCLTQLIYATELLENINPNYMSRVTTTQNEQNALKMILNSNS